MIHIEDFEASTVQDLQNKINNAIIGASSILELRTWSFCDGVTIGLVTEYARVVWEEKGLGQFTGV